MIQINKKIMKRSKTEKYECCMCGDHGLSNELFRCKICHFRSQHRYCSNLYPKAESYRVCNWCLIEKDDNNNHNHNCNRIATISTTRVISNNHHVDGPGPKSMKLISPIKKPMMTSTEAQSPSSRKRITAVNFQVKVKDDRLRRTKSSQELVSNNNNNKNNNNNNNFSNSSSSRSSSGGPIVIKHVFRNKVRRYKLLDEVSS
ncbi:hypothetical protein KSS87_020195 [Heliosperma pusillum]|nr:hypothetical protein KSS87_020195 [Heliosperma pusillum]